jgi:hypothetical protein
VLRKGQAEKNPGRKTQKGAGILRGSQLYYSSSTSSIKAVFLSIFSFFARIAILRLPVS